MPRPRTPTARTFPLRVALHGRIEELLHAGSRRDLVELALDLGAVHPRIAPLRQMFSAPVSSGWKPVPTSSRLATRPLMVTRPALGSVMRLSTLSSVDFPAPLRPMMPTASRRISSSHP